MGAPGDEPPVWRVAATWLGAPALTVLIVYIIWKVL